MAAETMRDPAKERETPAETATGNPRADFETVYGRYAKDVWRVCVLYFGGRKADAEDASQETFLRYWRAGKKPEPGEHTKAWLIVTAGNVCKDMLKKRDRRNVSLDSLAEVGARDPEQSGVLEALMKLPPKWKTAVYLHYYEGMQASEIADAMSVSESTVYVFLHKGRKRLKEMLEGNA